MPVGDANRDPMCERRERRASFPAPERDGDLHERILHDVVEVRARPYEAKEEMPDTGNELTERGFDRGTVAGAERRVGRSHRGGVARRFDLVVRPDRDQP